MSDEETTPAQPAQQAVQVVQMAQSVTIQPMPEFRPDAKVGASLATRWINWQSDFEMFLTASGITDAKRKRALLLYQAGPRVREIFKQLTDTGNDDDYEVAKAKLKEYFDPQKNRRYEVYRFRQAMENPDETLDEYHTRLRTMSATCEFNDVEFEIEQQIIIGGTSSKIRKRALRDPKFDLKSMLLEGRRDEQSSYQIKEIESKEPTEANTNKLDGKSTKTEAKTCHYCGREYPHVGQCPAKGQTCRTCGKTNHFARVCQSKTKQVTQKKRRYHKSRGKPIHPLQHNNSDNSDEDYLYAVNKDQENTAKVKVKVCGASFMMTLDTGATINVIDEQTFSKMDGVQLKPTNTKAFPYNSAQSVKFLGKFEAVIETRKRLSVAIFYVVKGQNSGNLLCLSTAQELGLITLHLNNLTTKDDKLDKVLSKHPKVFQGLGKLKGETVKLDIDKDHIPKAQPQRRILYHIRKKVEDALRTLEEEDIIERVPENEATPWVSPIVVVPKKDGGVRLCVDMRQANEAIRRVRHPIPTVNDVSFALNGAQYFTKLDLSQAYHQLVLDKECRFITTFSTHVGLYRYKRLNYGTNASAEIFQHVLQTTLQGLDGVKNIADDIIVFGKTRAEHDQNLDKCLSRLSNSGLKLNRDKCSFLKDKLEFFGQIFSREGTRPDPKRVNDLLNAPQPSSVPEVRSLLGMANYSSKYIPDFATLTAPLRELTKKNAQFIWLPKHQACFDKLKATLASAPCMSYFCKEKETLVIVDASPVGVSAILSQQEPGTDDRKVVAYASRTLTDTEQRYSQTEKEALAIVWSVEHFHLFLYGSEFILVTDHKPLEVIYGNRKAKASARIERWILRLQPYTFRIVYKSGANNPADYLSRHPINLKSRKQEKMTEEYINFLADNSVPRAMTLDEIIKAANSDSTLKGVRAAIRLKRWDSPVVQSFKSIKDELTVTTHGVILRGTRIVIPKSLQQKAVDIAHEAHLGVEKTKSLVREKIWFLQIDVMVKKHH